MFKSLADSIYKSFILNNNYLSYLNGLKNTLIISLFAVILGVVIGCLVAIIRYNAQIKKKPNILSKICDLYVMVVRGTPVTLQLLIMYFVIFGFFKQQQILIGILTFGLNSGAYVSEIIRGGIFAVDKGQMEAGRSMGLTSKQCMLYIIMPQVIKNTLPAICNEFIALIKETSVIGYIGLMDLTFAGKVIQSAYADAFFPLFVVAGVYLLIVYILSSIFKKLERRLSRSDRN
jgi:His/Glu/Gln/Arg/opine family amino acid ABC transporter permease subunit